MAAAGLFPGQHAPTLCGVSWEHCSAPEPHGHGMGGMCLGAPWGGLGALWASQSWLESMELSPWPGWVGGGSPHSSTEALLQGGSG